MTNNTQIDIPAKHKDLIAQHQPEPPSEDMETPAQNHGEQVTPDLIDEPWASGQRKRYLASLDPSNVAE
jgi:hypothetical protein